MPRCVLLNEVDAVFMHVVSAGTLHRDCRSPSSNAFLRYWVGAPRDRGDATQTRCCIAGYVIKHWALLARFHPERFCAEDFPCPVEAGTSRSTELACYPYLLLGTESRGGYDYPTCLMNVFRAFRTTSYDMTTYRLEAEKLT